MNVSLKGFHFFFHKKEFQGILEESKELFQDSNNLNLCCKDKMRTLISKEILKILSEKYENKIQVSTFIEHNIKFVEIIKKIFDFFC